MATEGGGSSGGSGGSGGGSGGPSNGDINAILNYLRYLSIGNDGDFTGNAGYGGDNTGPYGSEQPEQDKDRTNVPLHAASVALGSLSDRPRPPGDWRRRSQEIGAYGGNEGPTGRLSAFTGADVDVYSGLPVDIENPDPFTGLPHSDPLANADWLKPIRKTTPFPGTRRADLLSSPYLLASNGWQEVVVNDDPDAQYHVLDGTDIVQRDTAAFSQRYHSEGGDKAVIFRPDSITSYTPERITRDMQTMGRTDFYVKYSGKLHPDTLDQLASAMPKQAYTPPAEDKTKYMDSSGRIGTADGLAAQDLAARISHVSASTALGGAYSMAAVALGADTKEAARMGKLGDAWSPIFSMAAMAPMALKQPAPVPPPWSPRGDFGVGKLRLPIVDPHFMPTKSVGEAFQGATVRVATRLTGNQPLISNYLSPGQIRLATFGPWAQRIVFGNAVERALAQGSAPTGLLVHTGDIRPFPLGGPDFVGADMTPFAGFRFQVTTQLQWDRHWENDAPGTIYGLYR